MLLINRQIVRELNKDQINKFYKDFPEIKFNTTYEFRRPPHEFHRQQMVKGEHDTGIFIMMASASKRIPSRYVDDSNNEIMWVTNYTPATATKEEDFHRKPEEIRFKRETPIKVTNNGTLHTLLWFLMYHSDRKGSELNLKYKKGGFGFYLYDPEAEARVKNENRKHLKKALDKIAELEESQGDSTIPNEQLLMVARGFQIRDAHLQSPQVILDQLNSKAENNPKEFISRFSTAEFTTSSLVYEAIEKGIIINDESSHSWYTLVNDNGKRGFGEKIYTYLINEKPHAALINYLRNDNNHWLEDISKILKGSKQAINQVIEKVEPLTTPDGKTQARLDLEAKAKELLNNAPWIVNAKDETLKQKIAEAEAKIAEPQTT